MYISLIISKLFRKLHYPFNCFIFHRSTPCYVFTLENRMRKVLITQSNYREDDIKLISRKVVKRKFLTIRQCYFFIIKGSSTWHPVLIPIPINLLCQIILHLISCTYNISLYCTGKISRGI